METKEHIDMNKNIKAEIRKEVLKRREALDQEVRRQASLKLADRIIGHQWFYRSDTILIFASYGSEIDTKEILLEALRTGKRVYVPKVEGEQMNFYRIETFVQLCPGYKGIPEPILETAANGHNDSAISAEPYQYVVEEMPNTLMIMPGVAFDPFRNRIGYGKGFYDKYLADKPELQLRTIAVGFRCQQVEEIPAQESDIKPYQVILV